MKNKMKFKKIYASLAVFAVVLLPLISFAQSNTGGLKGFIDTIRELLIGSVVPLLFSLALVMFLWGVVNYVLYPDDEQRKSKGRTYMVWGLIGLTVMFSVWGLVRIFGDTFGLLDTSAPKQPQLPGN